MQANQVVKSAQDAKKSATNRADEVAASVGSGMQNLADTVRESAPRKGMMRDVASNVAGTLDSSGRYLQESGVSGMAGDVTKLIQRHPLPALFVCIGIGYLVAQLGSRR